MAGDGADKKVYGASSNEQMACYHCKEKATSFGKGWQLRTGDFARLCDSCGSAFEEGTFCERFHRDLDGWRDCVSCAKRIHCGCLVSADMLVTLDYGGMCCVDCGKNDIDQAEVKYVTQNATPDFWNKFNLELARKSSLKTDKEFEFENKLMRSLGLGAPETKYVGDSSASFDSFVPPEARTPLVPPGKLLDVGIRRSEGSFLSLENSENLPLASLEELSKSPGESRSVFLSFKEQSEPSAFKVPLKVQCATVDTWLPERITFIQVMGIYLPGS